MHIRTSKTHPLEIAEVRASDAHGRIGITFCPGKHDSHAATGAWERDLSLDLMAIKTWGAVLLVTLVEEVELNTLKVPMLGEEVRKLNMHWLHLPIADYSIPTDDFEAQWDIQGKRLRTMLRDGEDIVVHCKGGLGRAGMIAARLLVELGMEPEQAIGSVRRVRKGAIETPSQLSIVQNTNTITDDR